MDPAAGPVAAFAEALRELRRAAGNPTYASLSRRCGMSASALSDAARGRRLPTWRTVEAFVRACHGDPRDWHERWTAANGHTGTGPPAVPPPPAAAGNDTAGAGARDRKRRWRLVAAVGIAVVAVAAGGVLILRPAPRTANAGPAAPAAPGDWVRVMGPGCGPNKTGAQVDVDKGWTPSGGGWTGDGCDGGTRTAPLFDSPTDWNMTVGWTFEPDFPATCLLEEHIPDSPDAAGSAIYQIFGKDPVDTKRMAVSPPIPQAVYHGQWVSIGTYRFPDGILNIELGNLGTGTEHIAADAARATCHR